MLFGKESCKTNLGCRWVMVFGEGTEWDFVSISEGMNEFFCVFGKDKDELLSLLCKEKLETLKQDS